jgi:hypothetical protein
MRKELRKTIAPLLLNTNTGRLQETLLMTDDQFGKAMNILHDRIEENTRVYNDTLLQFSAKLAALVEIIDLTTDQKLDYLNRSKELFEEYRKSSDEFYQKKLP